MKRDTFVCTLGVFCTFGLVVPFRLYVDWFDPVIGQLTAIIWMFCIQMTELRAKHEVERLAMNARHDTIRREMAEYRRVCQEQLKEAKS